MTHKSLFCVGVVPKLRYGTYTSKEEAEKELGETAHYPDPDEMRHIWLTGKLYLLTTAEFKEKLGVSRQAVALWRKKAGLDMPKLKDYQREQREKAIEAELHPDKSANEIADKLCTTKAEVVRVAKRLGIELADKSHKKPDDEEIVRLAKGKTWRELAHACNVTLATLRNYVYANHPLSVRVCANVVHEPMGIQSHGKIDVDELVDLYNRKLSIFKLADHFGTQPMSIIYWLKKLGIYRGAEGKPGEA